MSRNFVVTGGSRGLGAAIVKALAGLGHNVLTTGRSEQTLAKTHAGQPTVQWVTADFADPQAAQYLADEAKKRLGIIHGLVNNAGVIDPIGPLAQADAKAWADAVTINFTTPSLLMGALLAAMVPGESRVVNISSGAAVKVVKGWSAYCSAKAGFLHLTRVAAEEYPSTVFFSLRPGVIDTEMQREIRESSGMTEADLAKFQSLKADGQLVPPEIPGRAAAWLALHGPAARSGEFIEYTDPEVAAGVESVFSAGTPKA